MAPWAPAEWSTCAAPQPAINSQFTDGWKEVEKTHNTKPQSRCNSTKNDKFCEFSAAPWPHWAIHHFPSCILWTSPVSTVQQRPASESKSPNSPQSVCQMMTASRTSCMCCICWCQVVRKGPQGTPSATNNSSTSCWCFLPSEDLQNQPKMRHRIDSVHPNEALMIYSPSNPFFHNLGFSPAHSPIPSCCISHVCGVPHIIQRLHQALLEPGEPVSDHHERGGSSARVFQAGLRAIQMIHRQQLVVL